MIFTRKAVVVAAFIVAAFKPVVKATVLSVAAVPNAPPVPASAGAVGAGAPITMFSSGPSFYVTSDTPAFTAVKGSICINTAGSGVSDRLFINNGTTNWVAITTAS